MSNDFTLLWSRILDSSVWQEPDHIRLVWITMLAMKSREGVVSASVLGLANRARVSLTHCQEALDKFLKPDPYSSTPDKEGRRIEAVPGGVADHQPRAIQVFERGAAGVLAGGEGSAAGQAEGEGGGWGPAIAWGGGL